MSKRRLWWLCLLAPAILAGTLAAAPEDPPPDATAAEPPPEPVTDRMCAACHAGVTLDGLSHAVLGRSVPNGACEACHGSGAAHAESPQEHPMLRDVKPEAVAALCLDCHRSGPEHVTGWVDSAYAKKGQSCTDCHTVHEKSDRRIDHEPDAKGYVGDDSCRLCHGPVTEAFGNSFHAGVIGKPGGGCEACHGPGKAHVAAAASGADDLAMPAEPERKACLTCHASAPKWHAAKFSEAAGLTDECAVCHSVHVDRNSPLYSDTAEVEMVPAGNEACARCHQMPGDSVHAKAYAENGCEHCHGPGSAHVESGGRSRFILNPAKATPAAASETCLSCHADSPDHAKSWKGGPLEKNGLSCLTCHEAHGSKEVQGKPYGAPKTAEGDAKYVGSKACMVCHENAHPGIGKSPHAGLMSDPKAGGCESCHGPGSVHVQSGGGKESILNPASMPKAERAGFCTPCHGKDTRLIRWTRSEHGKAGLDCTSCHDPLVDPKESSRKQDPDSCYTCHLEIKAKFRLSSTHPVGKGAMKCSDCHDPHRTISGFLALELRKEGCVECHKQYDGPFLYEHEADVQDGCLACHRPHGSTANRLLTHKNVRSLCVQCHITPSSHDLGPGSPFRNCLNCHGSIHGSYVDKKFFR